MNRFEYDRTVRELLSLHGLLADPTDVFPPDAADEGFTNIGAALVTSDWHMPRAYWELRRVLPTTVSITKDAVATRPRFNTLFVEYCKLLAQRIAALRHA